MFYLFIYNLEIFSAFWGLNTIKEKGSDEVMRDGFSQMNCN